MDHETRKPLHSMLLTGAVAIALLTPLAVFVLLRSQEAGPGMRDSTAPEGAASAKPASGRSAIPALESEVSKPKASPRPAPMPKAPAQPPSAARAFPSPKDIPIGVDKAWLLASFGKPNMITTEVTEGRPQETFRYLKPDSGIEVLIQLRSGRVVAASSSAY